LREVFEAFAQTESGRRANEGAGLGLAISRGLARVHGGDVAIESRRGEGTIVRVDVALPLASEAPLRERTRSVGRVIGLAPGQTPPRVLVVDDSPDNRQLLAELLRSAGCHVIEAADGEEGLVLWEKESPDLIFMDLRMQGMSGFEAMRTIHARQSSTNTRIVVLSASAFDHERIEALERGADAFLTKPFREEAVFAQLENLLGTRFARADSSSEIHAAGTLAREALATLPADLRIRLKAAAAGGESDVLQSLAAEAGEYDERIGAELAFLVRAYRFDEIEAALKEIPA